MHTVYGISLGPGDPELIPLRSLKILQISDAIFYPGSLFADGTKKSYVLPMLQHYGLQESRLHGFFLKMSDERSAAEATYAQTAQEIIAACKAGKKVSIVCEGDLSFYASFSYLLEKLKEQALPLELIPGVNSFSLGAALHQVPLCLQNERVAILPREADVAQMEHMLQDFSTLILMKIRSSWPQLGRELLQKGWQCYYCERLGTSQEFISTNLQEVLERDIPYFSLLIIKK